MRINCAQTANCKPTARETAHAAVRSHQTGETKRPPRCLVWVVSGRRIVDEGTVIREQAFGAVEKWESWFWISTFPQPSVLGFSVFRARLDTRRSCGNVGISLILRDFQGTVDRVGNLPLVFHAIHSSVITIALRQFVRHLFQESSGCPRVGIHHVNPRQTAKNQ